jgi:hypothetical protein
VAEAESAGWTHARLINTDCSVDQGLWQINSYWHGEVSDGCAFDPTCNANATHTIWANGGWTQWTTCNNGAYQAHMGEAQDAINQAGDGTIRDYGLCMEVAWGSTANGAAILSRTAPATRPSSSSSPASATWSTRKRTSAWT